MQLQILAQIDKAWSQVRRPVGFVADVSSESELTHELRDLEEYFRGRDHDGVSVTNHQIGYMCALTWMKADAAVYYTQCYLRFLVLNPASDFAVLDYVEGSLEDVDSFLTEEQRQVTRKVVAYFQEHCGGEI